MKIVNLLAVVFLLSIQADPPPCCAYLPYLSNERPVTVVVTNASDVVNGSTDDFHALQLNPGPDGISFREAVWAANHTSGSKMIAFSPSLKGATIVLGSRE